MAVALNEHEQKLAQMKHKTNAMEADLELLVASPKRYHCNWALVDSKKYDLPHKTINPFNQLQIHIKTP
jgi:hypothetical protein